MDSEFYGSANAYFDRSWCQTRSDNGSKGNVKHTKACWDRILSSISSRVANDE